MFTDFGVTDITTAILGFFVTVGFVAGLVAKSKGLLTFGKPVERRKNCFPCPEHPEVINKVDKITNELIDMRSDVSHIKEDVGTIRGYILGKNGASLG